MSPVHSPPRGCHVVATRLPAYAHQHAAAGQGAAESVAPLLGKFVRIL